MPSTTGEASVSTSVRPDPLRATATDPGLPALYVSSSLSQISPHSVRPSRVSPYRAAICSSQPPWPSPRACPYPMLRRATLPRAVTIPRARIHHAPCRPTLPCRHGQPPSRSTPCSPVAATTYTAHPRHHHPDATRCRLSPARTLSAAVGRRHHDRKKRMLQMYVSSILDVSKVCCKCCIWMLQK
jgi:hypothetical protein